MRLYLIEGYDCENPAETKELKSGNISQTEKECWQRHIKIPFNLSINLMLFTTPMAQALMGTAAWLAAINGYLSSCFILQKFGLTITLFYGITVAVISILILNLLNKPKAILG